MALWENIGRPLLTPSADVLYRQAESLREAEMEQRRLLGQYAAFLDQEALTAIDRGYDELARKGLLTSQTAGQLVGTVQAGKMQELGSAYMIGEMERARTRQEIGQLGRTAKGAAAQDVAGGVKKVAGLAAMIGGVATANPLLAGVGASMLGDTSSAAATEAAQRQTQRQPRDIYAQQVERMTTGTARAALEAQRGSLAEQAAGLPPVRTQRRRMMLEDLYPEYGPAFESGLFDVG